MIDRGRVYDEREKELIIKVEADIIEEPALLNGSTSDNSTSAGDDIDLCELYWDEGLYDKHQGSYSCVNSYRF